MSNKNKQTGAKKNLNENDNSDAQTVATDVVNNVENKEEAVENNEEVVVEDMQIPEIPTAEKAKKRIIKPLVKGIGFNDFGTWFTRPRKDGDKDVNGKDIPTDRVFVLSLEPHDIAKMDLPAAPLIYDPAGKDDSGNAILIAYKVPQFRNSEGGVAFKNAENKTETHHQYKQITTLVEDLNETTEVRRGWVGYTKLPLSQTDLETIAKEKEVKEAAAKKKAEEAAAKKVEREAAAKKKAEEAAAKKEEADKKAAVDAINKAQAATQTEGQSVENPEVAIDGAPAKVKKNQEATV